jgi:hypothetical protein
MYAVVSFDTTQAFNDMRCSAPWVRIALLKHTEQPMLSSDGKNVIALEDIREGAEIAVQHGAEGSQTILYVY